MSDPATLLLQAASLARLLAPQCCRTEPATGENCAWTHGLWPLLRLLGIVGSIEYRGEFFARAFSRIEVDAPRILLSGAADYATLGFVLDVLRPRGVQPPITLVDICETPLALNRWYAEQVGAVIETARCDILNFAPAKPFDLICTDAFIGRFPVARRAALLTQWHALLRPGGIAITYNRLRPSAGDTAVGFSNAQADSFVQTVTAAARPWLSAIGSDAPSIERSARDYARRHMTYPLRSAEEIRSLFENAGFAIELLETTDAASATAAVSGPSTRDGGSYAGLMARRA